MGAVDSKEDINAEFLQTFNHKFSYNREVKDKRFGEIQLFKSKTEEKFVAKRSQLCNSSEEYDEFVNEARERRKINHRNILQIYASSTSSEDNLCGDFNKVSIYFEYYLHDLEIELTRRRETQTFFSEQELWYMLEALISAAFSLEKQQIYHGDYRPVNILLTPEGFVKIADHGLINADHSNYFKTYYGREQTFLSPNQIASLKNRETKPKHDSWKSDVYGLGMTLLEAATLCHPNVCYDWVNLQIHHEIVDDLIGFSKTKYSTFLINIIRDMLLVDETVRPKFTDINNLLAPYAEKIRAFIPFMGPEITSFSQTIPVAQTYQPQVQFLPTRSSQVVIQPDQTAKISQINQQSFFPLQQQSQIQQVPLNQSNIAQVIPVVNYQGQSQPLYIPTIAPSIVRPKPLEVNQKK